MSKKKKKKPYYKDVKFLLEFGNHLRLIREKKDFTQEQLANACEFDISQISRIERGVSNTSISTINKIAASLDVSLAELFSFQEQLP